MVRDAGAAASNSAVPQYSFGTGLITMRNDDDYTELYRLKTKFVTPNAYLTIGKPHSVREIFPVLYRVQGNRHSRIQHLDDLTGKVRIESPEAALSFVRLYTSPRTYETLHG